MIAEQSTVPIYGLWEFYLGEGLTGGKLMSGHSQGNSAGQIVLSLLNGQQVGEI